MSILLKTNKKGVHADLLDLPSPASFGPHPTRCLHPFRYEGPTRPTAARLRRREARREAASSQRKGVAEQRNFLCRGGYHQCGQADVTVCHAGLLATRVSHDIWSNVVGFWVFGW